MSSQRLRSTLHHAAPRPLSRPPPLWQVAAGLDTAAVPVTPTGRASAAFAAREPARSAEREPATSAVRAGWICVGIGLLTAWFFPLAHVFFSIAIILSVVAMATHQVRAGLLLLAGSLASIGVCLVLFIGGVAMMVTGALHAATRQRLEIASFSQPLPVTRPATPTVTATHPVAQSGTVSGNSYNYADVRPDALTDVFNMLTAGRRDEEILAAIAGRINPSRIGTSEITSLRVYGASERLIDNLRTRPAAASVQRLPANVAQAQSIPTRVTATAPSMPAIAPPAVSHPNPAPVDYAARDRQIQSLQKAIDSVDEQVRRYRDASHYTFNQQTGDAYLKYLDKERDDLRRQKWALEGR